MHLHIGRRPAIAGIAVAALALAASAFAYFTASGSGTGTATVGSASSSITIKSTITGSLYPGSSTPVEVTVKNAGTQAAHVGSVTLTKVAVDASHSTCETTHNGEVFTMAPISVEKTLQAGESTTASGTLAMKETGVSQDGCQGATLTLSFTSN